LILEGLSRNKGALGVLTQGFPETSCSLRIDF